MFAHSYSKLSRTCYGESTPYALQKSSPIPRRRPHWALYTACLSICPVPTICSKIPKP